MASPSEPTPSEPTLIEPSLGQPTQTEPSSHLAEVADPAADIGRLRDLDDELAAVEGALRRLDEGTYGTCEVCGVGLDQATLAVQPALARCGAHPG